MMVSKYDWCCAECGKPCHGVPVYWQDIDVHDPASPICKECFDKGNGDEIIPLVESDAPKYKEPIDE